ncbi:hypothetical protein HOY34_01495 [Xinfangfangia sp. D13-10-4-6]|uniref:GumC family protein n=1 Tax=Pseudogemmobacter hezensis TaxID=2737662 RepID=UPI001553DEA0|nr:Wzz/FepE/Etk N-terminal domain-containing protein [Pseudogemmobacter hezensis]NPD13872.1 hypothetical protein [Pseudogemmobacter hezensis]
MGHIRNIEDLIGFLARRWWLIALVALGVTLLAISYAMKRPDNYTAWASIEIQTAQVTVPVAGTPETAVVNGSAQLVQSLQHRLTTRQNLVTIIERHGLYADAPAMSTETKVSTLRAAIRFDTVEVTGDPAYGQPTQVSAVVISVRFGDAENAARIANDLAQSVVDLSASGQLSRARESHRFHADRLTALSAEIQAQEAKIIAWRNQNAEMLPPVSATRREELVTLETDLRELDREALLITEERRRIAARENLRPTDRQRLLELDDQTTLNQGQQDVLRNRAATIEAGLAGVAVAERGLADLERDLGQIQRNFDQASDALAEADAQVRLAERQQGERFGILDRAITPEHADGPRRKTFVMAGAVAGILAGVILAFLLDLLKPIIRTSRQMERELNLRPIIALPELRSSARKGHWHLN